MLGTSLITSYIAKFSYDEDSSSHHSRGENKFHLSAKQSRAEETRRRAEEMQCDAIRSDEIR